MNEESAGTGWKEAVLWGVAGVLTRLPFVGRLPYHWDTVQFIMGMAHFDVRLHQPHPPGYLLYLWMGRALLPLARDPHRALVWLSPLFSGLGTAVLFRLAQEALGTRPARTAAAICLTGPLFWFFGEVALTYAADFALVGLVSLFAHRVYRGDASWRNILGMSVALGVAGGVRGTTLLFLSPLCLLAGLTVARQAAGKLATGAAATALLTAAWAVPTVAASGGWIGYRETMHAQRELVDQTAVWTAGWLGLADGLSTHAGCLVNAIGAALFALPAAVVLRLRQAPSKYDGDGLTPAVETAAEKARSRPSPTASGGPVESAKADFVPFQPRFQPPGFRASLQDQDSLPKGLPLFLLFWILPSALFYTLVHFASPGYAMTYLGAVLLAVAATLETLWRRMGKRGAMAALAGIAALNAWIFLLGVPFQGAQSGFGVLTLRELRDHERYWRQLGRFMRDRYRPGEAAVLVPASFTDGLRVAEYLLPEYWPGTGLAVNPVQFQHIPACLKPCRFRYVTPVAARRDPRPTLCVARVPEQHEYFQKLFGPSYHKVPIGGGLFAGTLTSLPLRASR